MSANAVESVLAPGTSRSMSSTSDWSVTDNESSGHPIDDRASNERDRAYTAAGIVGSLAGGVRSSTDAASPQRPPSNASDATMVSRGEKEGFSSRESISAPAALRSLA